MSDWEVNPAEVTVGGRKLPRGRAWLSGGILYVAHGPGPTVESIDVATVPHPRRTDQPPQAVKVAQTVDGVEVRKRGKFTWLSGESGHAVKVYGCGCARKHPRLDLEAAEQDAEPVTFDAAPV